MREPSCAHGNCSQMDSIVIYGKIKKKKKREQLLNFLRLCTGDVLAITTGSIGFAFFLWRFRVSVLARLRGLGENTGFRAH